MTRRNLEDVRLLERTLLLPRLISKSIREVMQSPSCYCRTLAVYVTQEVKMCLVRFEGRKERETFLQGLELTACHIDGRFHNTS